MLRENPELSLNDVAKKIGKSLRTVKYATKKLQVEKKLERIGSNKDGYWKVIEN